MSGTRSADAEWNSIAVVGCGSIGAAIIRSLARGGHRVLAWNRTFSRAEVLAGDRITPVRDLSAAVGGAPLVVVCTTSYETTQEALGQVADWSGKTLVNLTSGTPEEAEEMERWATGRGAAYLDGVVVSYPAEIGLPETMLNYAGPPSLWAGLEATLTELGGASSHISAEIGAANLIFNALAGFYTVALSGYVEAIAYTQGCGVPAAATQAMTRRLVGMLEQATEEAALNIETGEHETDQATIAIFLDGLQHSLPRMQAAGHPFRIFAATVANLEAAVDAGFGDLDLYAQSKAFREPQKGTR